MLFIILFKFFFFHFYLLFHHLLFYQIHTPCLIIDIAFLECQFASSSPVKNSYLPTFSDEKAEILVACLSKSF